MSKKIRTVFYAEEGVRLALHRMVEAEGFKSESDALCYLVALGMREHRQSKREEVANARQAIQK